MVGAIPQNDQQESELAVVEGQLTWLTYIIGALVGGRLASSSSGDTNDNCDAELSSRAFAVMRLVDQRLQAVGAQYCAESMDMAVLFFFHNFRRVYIGESALQSSRMYARLSERLRLTDENDVMNMLVTKIVNNLKFWYKNYSVVGRTLLLLQDLASGYSSSKMMVKLPMVQQMLQHHTQEYFPFMEVTENGRHRTVFYATLAKLLLMEESQTVLEAFMDPFNNVLYWVSKQSPAELQLPGAQATLQGLFRDFRGIAMACTNRRTFGFLFDIMYPNVFHTIAAVMEALPAESPVVNPLLKFVSEFVHNKATRLQFECSSANGILLFREASRIICRFGMRVMATPAPADSGLLYKYKYKGIWLSFLTLTRALAGNYVPFGVFELYGDPALRDSLITVLRLASNIPLVDLVVRRARAHATMRAADRAPPARHSNTASCRWRSTACSRSCCSTRPCRSCRPTRRRLSRS